MDNEEQVILRVPPRIADAVRRFVRGDADTGVSLEALDAAGNFVLRVGGDAWPAKLATLPTVVESHRTGDHRTYFKSGDVARVLYVYEGGASATAAAAGGGGAGAAPDPRLDAAGDVLPLVPDPTLGARPGDVVLEDGLTPPMQRAVRRRFKRAVRFIAKYPREEVAEAERVLLDLMSRDTYEHVIDELVDAEPFMAPWFAHGGDNVTIVYEDGVVTDMYQLQAAPGVEAPESRTARVPPPLVVRPNADATFGRPPAAGGADGVAGAAAASGGDRGAAAAPRAAAAAAARAAVAAHAPPAWPGGAGGGGMDGLTMEHLDAIYGASLADAGGGDGALGVGDGAASASAALAASEDTGAYDGFAGLDALPMDMFGDVADYGGDGFADGGAADGVEAADAAGTGGGGGAAAAPSSPPGAGDDGEYGGLAGGDDSVGAAHDGGQAHDVGAGDDGAAFAGGSDAMVVEADDLEPAGARADSGGVSAEVSRLQADVAEAEARVAALADACAARQAQADRTTLPALKNRWLAEVRKLQAQVAEAEQARDALRSQLADATGDR